jgi:hypothetical protein
MPSTYKILSFRDYDFEAIEKGLKEYGLRGWQVIDSWTVQGTPAPEYDPESQNPPIVVVTYESVIRAFLLEKEYWAKGRRP